ncbi:hypothetical protein BpHYR1_005223 [Brachionus plicatilis]|uniref:Uncharacterized protein n=1 Tax=Brachionus plicatilis TaxID=10195 RepID=A0A3M7RG53_BRAPC|nr:hypothetical protein BpHYR1_005223 [Brachionus plicatilis]
MAQIHKIVDFALTLKIYAKRIVFWLLRTLIEHSFLMSLSLFWIIKINHGIFLLHQVLFPISLEITDDSLKLKFFRSNIVRI